MGLILSINHAQAFYFLSERDARDSQSFALDYQYKDCIQAVATLDKQTQTYAYSTGVALGSNVVLTARHSITESSPDHRYFWDSLSSRWVKIEQVILPNSIKSDQYNLYPDDLAVCILSSNLSCTTYPSLTSKNHQETMTGQCFGRGITSWCGTNTASYNNNYASLVPVCANRDKLGCYRQDFITSDKEGEPNIRGFSLSDQPKQDTSPAFGMPGDSGAPVFDANADICGIYSHSN